MYDPIVKVWMPGGVDDPNLSVIKVIPEDGYYWNNKNGKMVAIAKMAAAYVTGKTMDDGIEGTLTLE
jgi:general stress protein 26